MITITFRFKGGAGSGNHGHSGRPGKIGGSAGGSSVQSSEIIHEAVYAVKRMVNSSERNAELSLSEEAISFLQQTVDDTEYTLYRGVGLVKGRYDIDKAKRLKVGDDVPQDLLNVNIASSYSAKPGVAKRYSSGKVSLVMEATVPKTGVLVDTRNIKRVLQAYGLSNLFDADDYKYFQSEAEVIVMHPASARVYSVKI